MVTTQLAHMERLWWPPISHESIPWWTCFPKVSSIVRRVNLDQSDLKAPFPTFTWSSWQENPCHRAILNRWRRVWFSRWGERPQVSWISYLCYRICYLIFLHPGHELQRIRNQVRPFVLRIYFIKESYDQTFLPDLDRPKVSGTSSVRVQCFESHSQWAPKLVSHHFSFVFKFLVNNTPVFFIRDPAKFPLFIHTQKRNPQTHLKDPNMMWYVQHRICVLRPAKWTSFFFLHQGLPRKQPGIIVPVHASVFGSWYPGWSVWST